MKQLEQLNSSFDSSDTITERPTLDSSSDEIVRPCMKVQEPSRNDSATARWHQRRYAIVLAKLSKMSNLQQEYDKCVQEALQSSHRSKTGIQFFLPKFDFRKEDRKHVKRAMLTLGIKFEERDMRGIRYSDQFWKKPEEEQHELYKHVLMV